MTNQKVALHILNKLGYRADAVSNGKEAIQALEATSYDLVLMDVQMPEMDGLEATIMIRDSKSPVPNHQIPIIAMTAHAMEEHRKQCLEAGMDDFVTKPVEPQFLAEAIERHLSGSYQPPKPSPTVQTTFVGKGAFDRAALLERLSGDEELLNEVIGVFIDDIPTQLEELKQALNDNDATVVRGKGHRIKGASANIQAQAMRDIAYEIEIAGRHGKLDEANPLLGKLEQEFQRLKHDVGDCELDS